MDFTEDKILGGRVTLFQPRKGYRVAVDSVLLAAAIPARQGQRVLDMGSGTGAISFCLQARVGGLEIDGFDNNPEHVELAIKGAGANNFSHPCRFALRDIREWRSPALYDYVFANPPFFDMKAYAKSPHAGKTGAHAGENLEEWVLCAKANLKPEGWFFVIFPYDKSETLIAYLKVHFAEINAFYIQPKVKMPPNRFILVSGGPNKPFKAMNEAGSLVLHKDEGGYTDEAEAIIRHAKGLQFLPE